MQSMRQSGSTGRSPPRPQRTAGRRWSGERASVGGARAAASAPLGAVGYGWNRDPRLRRSGTPPGTPADEPATRRHHEPLRGAGAPAPRACRCRSTRCRAARSAGTCSCTGRRPAIGWAPGGIAAPRRHRRRSTRPGCDLTYREAEDRTRGATETLTDEGLGPGRTRRGAGPQLRRVRHRDRGGVPHRRRPGVPEPGLHHGQIADIIVRPARSTWSWPTRSCWTGCPCSVPTLDAERSGHLGAPVAVRGHRGRRPAHHPDVRHHRASPRAPTGPARRWRRRSRCWPCCPTGSGPRT